MAKRKSIPYVLIGKETKMILGSGRTTKEKVKILNDKGIQKYSPRLQKREECSAKPVKKGGTKALANAK